MTHPQANAVTVIEEFWRLMASNDFSSVGAVLAEEFVLDWPQSNERIRRRERFAAVNAEYPEMVLGASRSSGSSAMKVK